MSAARSERQLALETGAARQMRDYLLTLTDDGQAIADSIEGETNLHDAIRRVYWAVLEDQVQIDGLKEALATLQGRQSRFEARVERLRKAIENGMNAGELAKLELPEATLSMRSVPPKVEVSDEAAVPARFWVQQAPKLDRKALGDALKAGETVPGATLGNGSVSLSVRRA